MGQRSGGDERVPSQHREEESGAHRRRPKKEEVGQDSERVTRSVGNSVYPAVAAT